jgi:hypothetical protein
MLAPRVYVHNGSELLVQPVPLAHKDGASTVSTANFISSEVFKHGTARQVEDDLMVCTSTFLLVPLTCTQLMQDPRVLSQHRITPNHHAYLRSEKEEGFCIKRQVDKHWMIARNSNDISGLVFIALLPNDIHVTDGQCFFWNASGSCLLQVYFPFISWIDRDYELDLRLSIRWHGKVYHLSVTACREGLALEHRSAKVG